MAQRLRASYFRQFRSLTLLVALLGIIFSIGRVDAGASVAWRVVVAVVYGAVFMAAGYLIGARRRWLVIYVTVSLVSMAASVVSSSLPESLAGAVVDCLTHVVTLVMLIYLVFRFALLDDRASDADRVLAGISGYLILGLLFYQFYGLLATLSPQAFIAGIHTSVGLDDGSLMYFSFVTLSTLGYGDITPATQTARLLSALQAVAGTLYLAVFISRLVSAFRR